MIEVGKNLFVGSDLDCESASRVDVGEKVETSEREYAIVHACESCYQKGVAQREDLSPSLSSSLLLEEREDIYLNLIDLTQEFQRDSTDNLMVSAIRFIEKHRATHPVLIHCNFGMSRSPSVALLYLAFKREISSDSFASAMTDFQKRYPKYSPGRGVQLYLEHSWQEILGYL